MFIIKDIIPVIASHCQSDDILSLLIASKELSALLTNQDMLTQLSELYKVPYTKDFAQLLRFSKATPTHLTLLAVMNNDMRVFRCHINKTSHNKISHNKIVEYAGEFSNYHVIKEIILAWPESLIDILLESVKQNRYWLVEKLLYKIYIKDKSNFLNHQSNVKLINYVKNNCMMGLIVRYVPINSCINIMIDDTSQNLELILYLFQNFSFDANEIDLINIIVKLPDDVLEKILDCICCRQIKLTPEYLYITIAFNKQKSSKMLLKFKQFHNCRFYLIDNNADHKNSAIKAYELLLSNCYLTMEDIIKDYQNPEGEYILKSLLDKNK
jgi:hypothetical protein